MCGRFALATDTKILKEHFRVSEILIEVTPNNNIAPQSYIPVLRGSPNTEIREMKWGFIPSWSREPKAKFANINARSETVMSSAAYRKSFVNKRCLIPATGFYEWQVQVDGSKKPIYIHLPKEKIFAMAGLYDIWIDAEDKKLWTCTILTTEADDFMKPIHDRMPIILEESVHDLWLNSQTAEADALSIMKSSKNKQLQVEDGVVMLKS